MGERGLSALARHAEGKAHRQHPRQPDGFTARGVRSPARPRRRAAALRTFLLTVRRAKLCCCCSRRTALRCSLPMRTKSSQSHRPLSRQPAMRPSTSSRCRLPKIPSISRAWPSWSTERLWLPLTSAT
eukprot:7153364-Prymnesium_polylepis.5